MQEVRGCFLPQPLTTSIADRKCDEKEGEMEWGIHVKKKAGVRFEEGNIQGRKAIRMALPEGRRALAFFLLRPA